MEVGSPLVKYVQSDQAMASEWLTFHRAIPVVSFEKYRQNQHIIFASAFSPSVSTLTGVVERFSMNVGCQPPNEVIDQELALFNGKETRDAGADLEISCHPNEITVKLEQNVPDKLPAEETLPFRRRLLRLCPPDHSTLRNSCSFSSYVMGKYGRTR
ncbi:hypothetical protein PQQ81_10275 [Paraburkholderia strydomiana]|uniref:hypothetical protein n=1 Tax=Paraburkholderia strydomiana TaxID=1245417 RepID=UPI0038B87F0D